MSKPVTNRTPTHSLTIGTMDYPSRGALLLALLALFALPAVSWAQMRVVNYNIAQLRGNWGALQNVLTALHEDDKPGFAVPVAIFVFQEVRTQDVNPLTSIVTAAAPAGVSYTRGTFTSSVSEDGSGGAQAIFFRTGMLFENTAMHQDIFTGAGRNADRWMLRLVGYNSPLAWMYVYSAHLKSDTGSTNQQLRLDGVIAIRSNADALGANLHILYCGDMNFYTNVEPGYQQFISAGNGQAIDPLGYGSWAGGNTFPANQNNWKHTQSPLFTSTGGLVGGGMDDRFDFQFSTNAMHDGAGLAMLPNTYRSLGNDGLHWKLAIDSGNNFYYPDDLVRSNALATNLRLASDHIPVVVDYQIPAMMAAAMPTNYGRVIVGTPFGVSVEITNPANVQYQFGADVLAYSATGTLNLSGTFAGSVLPLGDVASAMFPLNTSAAGIRNGTVTITSSSQGVQPASLVLNTTGTVVRRSNPSFSQSTNITQLTLPLSYEANTGTHQVNVPVHNRGFDALQALLDLDAISAVDPPFSFVGGMAGNIGSMPATLAFAINTNGLSPGDYIAPVTIDTSDEDIPGEGFSSLELTIIVSISGPQPTCVADISPPGGDGVVNVNDLLAVINAWGACPAPPEPCYPDIAPTGGDGMVNVNDLLAVINGWGVCP